MSKISSSPGNSELLPVVPSPALGGSGHGISYYSRYAFCPRAFWLDRELEASGQRLEGTAKQDLGTLFHSLAETFYNGMEAARLVSDFAGSVSDANALWDSFQSQHPNVDWFGEVLGVEQLLEAKLGSGAPITGKADLVVKMTEDSVVRLEKHGVFGPEPGQVWLVDHKTTGRRSQDMHLKFLHSNQFALYCWLYEQTTGVKPHGTIVNVVINTKTVQFEKIAVPSPSDAVLEAILFWVNRQASLVSKGQRGSEDLSLASCFTYGACSHLVNGRCNRT